MNINEFSNTLKHPRNISAELTIQLENIIEEFPYFQAAHFLYLNGLKNQHSFKYNNALKKTAAYTTDRDVLFDFITSNSFNFQPNQIEVTEEKKMESKETHVVQATEVSPHKPEELGEEKSIEETLSLGKPLQFDVSETHSFNEWLQITSIKPIERVETEEIDQKTEVKNTVIRGASNAKNFDLIEKFIAENPKIKPSKTFISSDIATESVLENEHLMTETLAHVYLEQKKYQKAITAFTILSLKYPEKSSFFANQIEAIKKLEEK